MIRVYIAGPYTSNPAINVPNAIRFGMDMRDIDRDIVPFVPHLYHFSELIAGERHYSDWMEMCLEEVSRSDALIRIPGDSPGADIEVEAARKEGIPIVFVGRAEEGGTPENAVKHLKHNLKIFAIETSE